MTDNRTVRLLFFSDTHLGFDFPVRPRVERRRRGPDFFANFEAVLLRARKTRPDFVVHGGDLFFRSKVAVPVVDLAYNALQEFSTSGIDLFMVPGNHERSQLPDSPLFSLPNVHLFDRPRTFTLDVRGTAVALAGFPFVRENVRGRFPALLAETGWEASGADLSLLCLHQAVDGSRVAYFTFRGGPDVVAMADLPTAFSAALCGHIHRRQILASSGPGPVPLPPVIYPGSIERTSFMERDEEKGFYEIELRPGRQGRWLANPRFVPLPARPMEDIIVDSGITPATLRSFLEANIRRIDPDAVVRIKPGAAGALHDGIQAAMTAAFVREVFPATMSVQFGSGFFERPGRRRAEMFPEAGDASCAIE